MAFPSPSTREVVASRFPSRLTDLRPSAPFGAAGS